MLSAASAIGTGRVQEQIGAQGLRLMAAEGTMGDYGGDDRATSITVRHFQFQWQLIIGAVLALAAIYAVLPASDSGPNSVTVVGISAPRPAFGSYPGLRVPVPRRTERVAPYRT